MSLRRHEPAGQPTSAHAATGAHSSDGDKRADLAQRRIRFLETLVVLLASASVASVLSGREPIPHADFYEFRESGRALLHGKLPQSTKRGPVYCVLLAGVGESLERFGVSDPPADQRAASWIVGLSLVATAGCGLALVRLNAPLLAAFTALWIVCLPLGLITAAQALVEPLLAACILGCVLASARGSRWAYVLAAVATLTRFDAAGLVLGVALADFLARRAALRRVLLLGQISVAPLIAWLALTALNWNSDARDHYLAQMQSSWQQGGLAVDWMWAASSSLRAAIGDTRPTLPILAADLQRPLESLLVPLLAILGMTGLVVGCCRREALSLVAACFLAGYLGVHAFFPFRFERFGFPAAPLICVLACRGAAACCEIAMRWANARVLLVGVVALAMPALLAWSWGECDAALGTRSAARSLTLVLAGAVLVCGLLLFLNPGRTRSGVLAGPEIGTGTVQQKKLAGSQYHSASRACLLFAAALLTLAGGTSMLRSAVAQIGNPESRPALLELARWVRDHTHSHERILTGVGGLLGMYTRDEPARFPGFEQIAAESWPQIVEECRRDQVCYMIAHDDFIEQQGPYYIEKWRMRRFTPLAEPRHAPGVTLLRRFEGSPAAWIVRINDAADTPP